MGKIKGNYAHVLKKKQDKVFLDLLICNKLKSKCNVQVIRRLKSSLAVFCSVANIDIFT